MEAKTNYARVGLMVVILSAALLLCALWLSVGFEKKKYKTYAVYFHESVSGLNDESPVKYNGVQVGTVGKIELSRVNPQDVKLLLYITEGTPITTSTTATLISQGITGTTFVGLSASSADLTPLQKRPEEPYPIIPSRPSLFNQFDRILKEISENVNTLSNRLKKIISDENAANLKETLSNIKDFTQTVREHDKQISNTLDNADVLIKNLADSSHDFPEVIKDLKSSINKLTEELSLTSQNISITMKAGKTAIDKISDQTIPPAVELLHQLNNIAANLEKVSVQMRKNPAIVIRGTTPPTPGPGER